jgi:hypothetical protein
VRRAVRILRTVATLLSLTLCLVSAGAWARSRRTSDGYSLRRYTGFTPRSAAPRLEHYDLVTASGGVQLSTGIYDFHVVEAAHEMKDGIELNHGSNRRRVEYPVIVLGPDQRWVKPSIDMTGRGYQLWAYSSKPPQARWDSRTCSITVPIHFVTLLTAILPALSVRRFLRLRKSRTSGGHPCPACGYDLRATPHRCPECGREAPPTPS